MWCGTAFRVGFAALVTALQRQFHRGERMLFRFDVHDVQFQFAAVIVDQVGFAVLVGRDNVFHRNIPP